MTASFPTSGADDHPEVAEISAFDEGLLPPERSTEVSAHLSSCELCADVQSSLLEIRDVLGTLPGPARMPEDIASRIDAALAAERLLDSTTATASGHDVAGGSVSHEPVSHGSVSRETAKPGVRDGREPRRTRRPPSRPSGSTGPGRDGSRSPRRRRLLLGAAAACAVLLAGGVMVPMMLGEDSQQQAADSSAQESSGITAADLDTEVRKLLDDSPKDTPEEAPSARDRDPAPPSDREDRGDSGASPEASQTGPFGAETSPEVPQCVIEGIGRTEAPLAASKQTYEGKDSFLVVLPSLGDQQRVDAYVVDAACEDGGTGEPGEVLTEETVSRR